MDMLGMFGDNWLLLSEDQGRLQGKESLWSLRSLEIIQWEKKMQETCQGELWSGSRKSSHPLMTTWLWVMGCWWLSATGCVHGEWSIPRLVCSHTQHQSHGVPLDLFTEHPQLHVQQGGVQVPQDQLLRNWGLRADWSESLDSRWNPQHWAHKTHQESCAVTCWLVTGN